MAVNLIIPVENRRSNYSQACTGERCRQPASVGKSKLHQEQIRWHREQPGVSLMFMDTLHQL